METPILPMHMLNMRIKTTHSQISPPVASKEPQLRRFFVVEFLHALNKLLQVWWPMHDIVETYAVLPRAEAKETLAIKIPSRQGIMIY